MYIYLGTLRVSLTPLIAEPKLSVKLGFWGFPTLLRILDEEGEQDTHLRRQLSLVFPPLTALYASRGEVSAVTQTTNAHQRDSSKISWVLDTT
jgi:hypothetical protein